VRHCLESRRPQVCGWQGNFYIKQKETVGNISGVDDRFIYAAQKLFNDKNHHKEKLTN
jgi:hypothetical protein